MAKRIKPIKYSKIIPLPPLMPVMVYSWVFFQSIISTDPIYTAMCFVWNGKVVPSTVSPKRLPWTVLDEFYLVCLAAMKREDEKISAR